MLKQRALPSRSPAFLIEQLSSPDPIESGQAIIALGDRGSASRDAEPAIRALLNDPVSHVRSRAKWALETIAVGDHSAILQRRRLTGSSAWPAIPAEMKEQQRPGRLSRGVCSSTGGRSCRVRARTAPARSGWRPCASRPIGPRAARRVPSDRLEPRGPRVGFVDESGDLRAGSREDGGAVGLR